MNTYYLRRNRFKIAGMIVLALIALIIFIPAPQAKLNPPSSALSLPSCVNTIGLVEQTYTANRFVFISAMEIEDNSNYDLIRIYISLDYPLISYLTSKEGCVIDATIVEYSEAL